MSRPVGKGFAGKRLAFGSLYRRNGNVEAIDPLPFPFNACHGFPFQWWKVELLTPVVFDVQVYFRTCLHVVCPRSASGVHSPCNGNSGLSGRAQKPGLGYLCSRGDPRLAVIFGSRSDPAAGNHA